MNSEQPRDRIGRYANKPGGDGHAAAGAGFESAAEEPQPTPPPQRAFHQTVTPAGFEQLQQQVTRRNRRLAAAGLDWQFTIEGRDTVVQLDDGSLVEAVEVGITRPEVGADGWRMVARYDAVDPDVTGGASSYVIRSDHDDIDQPQDARCDHCQSTRHRRKLYLIEHPATGEHKQVGATCVQPFLGFSTPVADSVFDDFEQPDDDDDFGYGGGDRGAEAYATDELLVAAIRASDSGNDWRRNDRFGTGSAASARKLASAGITEVTDDERELAAEILAWGQQDNDEDGDYVRSVKATLRASHPEIGPWVGSRHAGLAASAVVAYHNEREWRAQREARERLAAKVNQEWVGRAPVDGKGGERLRDRPVTVIGVSEYETADFYGNPRTGHAIRMMDEDGHLLTWMSTSAPVWASDDDATGRTLSMTGTVSAHEEFRGDKVTRVNRVKFAER